MPEVARAGRPGGPSNPDSTLTNQSAYDGLGSPAPDTDAHVDTCRPMWAGTTDALVEHETQSDTPHGRGALRLTQHRSTSSQPAWSGPVPYPLPTGPSLLSPERAGPSCPGPVPIAPYL